VTLVFLRNWGSALRQLGAAPRIASALCAALVALAMLQPAQAQMFSDGYQFLKAVKDRDGDTATDMLNQPGTQIVNTRDISTGETGLHVVTNRRDTLWVRFLLQKGADPNVRDNNGTTALQIATRLGFIEGVEELVKGGAEVNVSDASGETPLMSAVHQRNIDLVRRLLAEGADPDLNDNSGRSARDYMELMNQNTLLAREFAAADEAREGSPGGEQYGPSF
jgi:hypothetical protein